MNKSFVLLSLLAAGTSMACQFHARGPDDFRKDTRALLETREPKIRDCYEDVLKKDKKAHGEVVVRFVIEKKTGDFKDIQVAGDAPDSLKKCVAKAIEGLHLTPVDERDGRAEFSYDFKIKK
jgi:hypothetical protein